MAPNSIAGNLLLREFANTTKGKGLKRLWSRPVRFDIKDATNLDVTWNAGTTLDFADMLARIDGALANVTASIYPGPDTNVIRYTVQAVADMTTAKEIVFIYFGGAPLANIESGNPVRNFAHFARGPV